MPNHVKNIVRINGTKEEINEVLESISSKDLPFDFNTITPMPKELDGGRSPVDIVTKEKREEQLKAIAEFDKNSEGKHSWHRPHLGLTVELQKQYMSEFGADNWYDWRLLHWGTKWGAYNAYVEDNQIHFDTAWSHPAIIMEKLSAKFPNILFHVQYADEDIGYNLGEYTIKDNNFKSIYQSKGGGIEAVKFACEVQGYDYEEYLEDMKEG